MSKISNPELKNMIYDIVFSCDEVGEDGANVKRSSFNKEHLRGVLEIKNNTEKSLVLETKDSEDSPVSLISVDDFKKREKKPQVLRQFFADKEVEYSQKALNAVKYYYALRSDLPMVSDSTLDEFESLVKDA